MAMGGTLGPLRPCSPWCVFAFTGDLETCACVRFPGVGNGGGNGSILGGWWLPEWPPAYL
ncbi:hypothetical protein P691DRAFT_807573 [Macrolepiota fuliginosa MF-IS2]|uniref:Uncharacterized protein n=1 Tax=Macrolepiota fuliginosa MF-IS2 TaxID=1400762 RepID=A0A9P6BVD5_9AGAR|nr:hypothetical protein P691DRAFT_807573 [Macrolepiota fuliginosa MF-IS2]